MSLSFDPISAPAPLGPSPRGAAFSHGGPCATEHPLRGAISGASRVAEPLALAPMLAFARQSDEVAARTDALARRLVRGLREGPDPGGRAGRVQSLMQAFSLSSDEGVALMCLAEALLRIPDAATRDALIRDKIGRGDWQQHVGHSGSLFVNAASWGLLLTGKLMATHHEGQLLGALARLVGRGSEPLIRQGVQLAMQMLGEQFVTGETIEEALQRASTMEALGFSYSYDMLGEAALTDDDAKRYLYAYEHAIHAIGRASAGRGVALGPGISIKLSALHPRYSRAQRGRVTAELWPRVLGLAEWAQHYGIGLNIDAEEADRLDLSLDLLEALCAAPSLAAWQGLGFVVQAYGKRSFLVIDFIVDLARRTGRRLMVRLVKGAYWDSEIKRTQVDGQIDYPVFTRKHHTDVAYLACARKLLGSSDAVYPQFATHNAHTVASIVQMGLEANGSYRAGQYEFQCLHGMGEPLYRTLVGGTDLRRPCRIYAPVGTHETLLAYLVRRLLENGANSSFVNRMADPTFPLDELVRDPVQRTQAEAEQDEAPPGQPHPQIAWPERLYGAARRNSTGPDLAHEPTLAALVRDMAGFSGRALSVGPMLGVDVVWQDGQDGQDGPMPLPMATPMRNPADADDVLGTVRPTGPLELEAALQAAKDMAPGWACTAPAQRAALLEQAADLLQAQGPQCMALLVREAGKTWAHAVAELREAVDFLRYYAAQVRRDFNNDTHIPLGPVVCISPWNFPLAIFTGQVAAALSAGNTVLAKPAEQTPAVAALAVETLWRAGVPRAAVQLLPGSGRGVGQALVEDARVQGVMFTGSTQTAKMLQTVLARRLNALGGVVPLIAETGGQNCMIVDSSALLEQVVQDAVASAFEAAGQRCSALRVLCVQDEVADRVLELLKGAMAQIRMGTPAQLHTDMGPVIDARARDGVEAHVERMRAAGRAVHRILHPHSDASSTGTYVPPTLIEILDLAELEREVFGPVLHVLRWRRGGMRALLEQIKSTGYALTLGVHSRIDETIAEVVEGTPCGNVYVNRSMVGAVVGVQPFGGEGLSGTGPKAGGPLYLLRLLSRCPDDAALRSVQASGAAAMPRITPALQALHDWALGMGRLSLAHQCARWAACNPAGLEAAMAGPTGERNVYRVLPRTRVWCQTGGHPGAWDDLLSQIAAVLAVGGSVCLSTDYTELRSRLPLQVQERIECRSLEGTFDINAALIHAEPTQVLALAHGLATQLGPVVSLTALKPGDCAVPLARLVTERSVSTNTAAAGGNASLMTLGG